MKAASAAGFRYAVLTSRHHDAFFLGDSKYGDWHAGNYLKRDLIDPWVKACRDNNIKVGFYFSGPDWYHSREYMNFSHGSSPNLPIFNWKHQKVTSLPPMPEELSEEISRIAKGQITELLTKYGKIDLFWPDGGVAGYEVDEFRKLQPGMILGRGFEYATPEGMNLLKIEYMKEANRLGIPWELCIIGNGGSWHWSPRADCYGWSARYLLEKLAFIRSRGGNLLLNIAPRPDGQMPPWFYPLCEDMAEWMKKNSESIYDIDYNGPFPFPDQCGFPVTTKNGIWYVFFPAKNDKDQKDCSVTIKDVKGKLLSAKLLNSGEDVAYEAFPGGWNLILPAKRRSEMPDVVKLVFENTTQQPVKQ
jgi:alpha-L-fucosidase